MIIKVCGLKFEQNLIDVASLDIDMVGYNFYEPSPRYVQNTLPNIPSKIKKVGVFVNASESTILLKANEYNLDYVQLHGDESPEFCKKIKETIPVIKVFRVDDLFDFNLTYEYEFCDFFLFDTASKQFGGSGQKFDWSILKKLDIKVPFLLSGGIGADDLDDILKIEHPKFIGIDINSKFEVSPGLKDVEKVKNFVSGVKNSSAFEDVISPLGAGGNTEIKFEETSARDPQSLKGSATHSTYDMFYGATPHIFETAGSLRRNMTNEEIIIWNYLKTKPMNLKFRRQHPINSYIADFYCHSIKLVIEIDGANHFYNQEKDLTRDTFFESLGITTIRINNNEVNMNLINTIEKIDCTLSSLKTNNHVK